MPGQVPGVVCLVLGSGLGTLGWEADGGWYAGRHLGMLRRNKMEGVGESEWAAR